MAEVTDTPDMVDMCQDSEGDPEDLTGTTTRSEMMGELDKKTFSGLTVGYLTKASFIYTSKTHCRFVCVSVRDNLSCLKS